MYRGDTDPMIRGLALRSLCSMRLTSILEYVTEPLRRALVDQASYVRKTGVMGVLKVYHLDPSLVKVKTTGECRRGGQKRGKTRGEVEGEVGSPAILCVCVCGFVLRLSMMRSFPTSPRREVCTH